MLRLRLLCWPMMAVIGLTVSACATMDVSSHVLPGLDFTKYHSWEWAPPDALPTSDARLDSPFFRDHFQGAVERQMARRGLVQSPRDAKLPDLLVHYHANVSPRITPNPGDPTTGACYDEDCSVRVFENEVGTMMLDVVDAHTNRLIWRGWAQTSVEGLVDHPKRFDDRIQKAVKGMFTSFPHSI